MYQRVRRWENSLLTIASEALHASVVATSQPICDADLLKSAYAYCETLTAQHSRSFHLASRLLPSEKRKAVRALYAFCRVTDDIVDRSGGDAEARLQSWRQQILTPDLDRKCLVGIAWTDTRIKYHIPLRYAEHLLDGVARDLYQTRYETFEDLATYCYGVASTVGLMAMHIVGFDGPEAVPYAIKLGVALQLTNILRDVGEDYDMGRVYLPQEELTAFGLGEVDLAAGSVSENWRAFMRFQIARNRQLYAEAWAGLPLLNRDGQLAIAVAADVYRAILDDIEAHDYDIFRRRAYVTRARKLRRLLSLWWRYRLVGSPS